MKAHPYLIQDLKRGKGTKLQRFDPRKRAFDEKWLQELLVNCPDILPTGEIEPIFSPLTVIGKEVQVSEGRIDILYLSASGYPVIAETKLWRNPESRREVVAQVLDYAVALSRWTYDQLEKYTRYFTSTYQGKAQGLQALLEDRFGDLDIEYDEFRAHVEKNLSRGRFLLAVIGDKIRASSLDIMSELNTYPGLGLEFAMIELECFSVDNHQDTSLLMIPRIAKRTEIIERSLVEVNVHQDAPPEIRITQEKIKQEATRARATFLTEIEFWEQLKAKAPKNYDKVKALTNHYQEQPDIEIDPGRNGLRFRKILSNSARNVSLFFLTTDSSLHVPLQAPLHQFKALGFDANVVEVFGQAIKRILHGYSSRIHNVDLEEFHTAIVDFIENIEQQEIENLH